MLTIVWFISASLVAKEYKLVTINFKWKKSKLPRNSPSNEQKKKIIKMWIKRNIFIFIEIAQFFIFIEIAQFFILYELGAEKYVWCFLFIVCPIQ